MVAADSTFRKVIIHPVAVEVPAPLSHIIVADLDEILGGIYVTEVTESLVVQVLEALRPTATTPASRPRGGS